MYIYLYRMSVNIDIDYLSLNTSSDEDHIQQISIYDEIKSIVRSIVRNVLYPVRFDNIIYIRNIRSEARQNLLIRNANQENNIEDDEEKIDNIEGGNRNGDVVLINISDESSESDVSVYSTSPNKKKHSTINNRKEEEEDTTTDEEDDVTDDEDTTTENEDDTEDESSVNTYDTIDKNRKKNRTEIQKYECCICMDNRLTSDINPIITIPCTCKIYLHIDCIRKVGIMKCLICHKKYDVIKLLELVDLTKYSAIETIAINNLILDMVTNIEDLNNDNTNSIENNINNINMNEDPDEVGIVTPRTIQRIRERRKCLRFIRNNYCTYVCVICFFVFILYIIFVSLTF